jgi:hypothetical protein
MKQIAFAMVCRATRSGGRSRGVRRSPGIGRSTSGAMCRNGLR